MNTKYTLAGLGLTVGLAVAAAAAPALAAPALAAPTLAAPALAAPATPEPISAQVTKATSASRATPKPEPKADAQPAPTTHLAKTSATLDGIGVALVPLLIGAALVIGGHIIDRRLTK